MATKAQARTSSIKNRTPRPPKPRGTSKAKTSGHAGRKAVYALEEFPATGRPSRKSTRGASSNHIRQDSSLHAKAVAQTMSPSRRSAIRK